MEKKVWSKYAKKISLFNFFASTIMIHKYYYLFTRPSVIVVMLKVIFFFQIPSLFNFFRGE